MASLPSNSTAEDCLAQLHHESKKRERKKQQNRIAQRNYRYNQKKRLQALEDAARECGVISGSSDMSDSDTPSTAVSHLNLLPTGMQRNFRFGAPSTITTPMTTGVQDTFQIAQYPAIGDTASDVPDIPISPVFPSNCTPLQIAIQTRNQTMTQIFLSKGADVLRQNSSGATALHLASATGQIELVSTVLAAGGRVNDADHSGETPLFKAAQEGNPETVKLLLESGADPNVGNIWGDTPLHIATKAGLESLVLLLLEYGAQVDASGPVEAATAR
ncbi:ankyrin [Sarocladium strictum]